MSRFPRRTLHLAADALRTFRETRRRYPDVQEEMPRVLGPAGFEEMPRVLGPAGFADLEHAIDTVKRSAARVAAAGDADAANSGSGGAGVARP